MSSDPELGSCLSPNCSLLPVTFLMCLSLAPPYSEGAEGQQALADQAHPSRICSEMSRLASVSESGSPADQQLGLPGREPDPGLRSSADPL